MNTIENYTPFSENETKTKERFLSFMQENSDCYLRSNLKGHLTASAFVIDPAEEKILLIHHKKLNRWLQPGGHCDGETNTLAVAIKEVFEETGVEIAANNQKIIDLDIHTIPERKEVPEHEHFDVRYLLWADSNSNLVQNHETNDLKWIKWSEIKNYTNEDSILRILDKINL